MNLRLAGRTALLLLAFVLAACNRPQPTAVPPEPTAPAAPTAAVTQAPAPTAVATEPAAAPTAVTGEPLYLSILWHQHQPIYFKDPETGVYQKPWVRLHAAKDYVDMAAMLERYPEIQAAFNLTPSLLRQLQDLKSGAKDLYQVYTEIPATDLTGEDKAFIESRFFDINPKIIARFPRYQEIAGDRANHAGWDAQTWLDLQVLFNLGWTDPDWLAQEPLAGLVAQGRDFSEADKATVLAEHARLVAQVIPLHKRLQDQGRIEITTTPFFHPILPLLFDTNLATVASPDVELPPRFSYPLDAIQQVELGVDYYQELFGRAPRGMWPAEGAVAQEIVNMVAGQGIQWMATDEEVLARSLGRTSFARDAQDLVQDADALYRPYVVSSRSNQMATIFRDKVISDKVGFTYSGTPGQQAAQDFVDRILAIRRQLADTGATGPHLVSVILDGENAWENYPNDGKEFLNSLYDLLQQEQEKGTIRTITPGDFVIRFPDQPAIDSLWAGSWVSPDYLTWIGEPEENLAWDYLGQARAYVERKARTLDEETLAQMMDAIYAAEGSDWFWWYGADQNSGDDGSFDAQFRATLQRVYELGGDLVPTFLQVPIIPQTSQPPTAPTTRLVTPQIDGLAAEGEWDGAGYYQVEGGVQANPNQVVSQLWYAFDQDNLYLRLDARRPWADVGEDTRAGFYLAPPGSALEAPFSRASVLNGTGDTLLGFGANLLVEVATATGEATLYQVDGDGNYVPVAAGLPAAVAGSTVELAVPYLETGAGGSEAGLARPGAGDVIKLRAVVSEGEQRDVQVVPGGPAELVVPDLGLTRPVLHFNDPLGDDHGPGSYTYPTDAVFAARSYDLIEFSASEDDRNLIFRFDFAGPLNNEWGAPNGMGIHTLDVYLDVAEGGARKLLPGRNAALPEGSGWEFAIWAEGWTPGLYGPPSADSPGPQPIGDSDTLNIVSDPDARRITVRVPKQVLADSLGLAAEDLNPDAWGYLAVVLGQEGFPASGVWRVRDVDPTAAQFRFGGAPAESTTHTRIIDVAYPRGFVPSQELALSNFRPRNVSPAQFDALAPEDFAQLPMLSAQ